MQCVLVAPTHLVPNVLLAIKRLNEKCIHVVCCKQFLYDVAVVRRGAPPSEESTGGRTCDNFFDMWDRYSSRHNARDLVHRKRTHRRLETIHQIPPTGLPSFRW